MSSGVLFETARLELSEVVNSLLDKGVVLRGGADISVAGIDLITLDLGVLLVAVETELRRRRTGPTLAGTIGAPELTPERAARVKETADVGEKQSPNGHSVRAGTTAGPEGRRESLAHPVRGRAEVSLQEVAPSLPQRVNVDPEGVQNGLARLVLTLIEVLRKVLEHQAIRRMEGGSLSEHEVEQLGLGLLRLHDQMKELKAVFGLTDEDLEIDLGPLGRVR